MTSRVAKRQKLNAENVRVRVGAAECVSFDALVEEDYPVDLIAENALRMLNYGHLEGVGEVLSLAIRCAGCLADFLLEYDADERVSDFQIERMTDEIETACVANECPSTFPIQKRPLLSRLTQLLSTVAAALLDSENLAVLRLLSRFVAALTKTRIQSLRYTATVFAGTLLKAVASNGYGSGAASVSKGPSRRSARRARGTQSRVTASEGGEGDAETIELLVAALSERCGDIAVIVRRRAVADLGSLRSLEASRALNDVHGTVRLAALHALDSAADSWSHDDTYSRVEQIAVQDVDLSVRRAALRLLAAKPNENVEPAASRANLSPMLQDEDALSRKLAAEAMLVRESEITPVLLITLAHTENLNRPAALALAAALAKVSSSGANGRSGGGSTSKGGSPVSVELVQLLTVDFDRESRKPRLSNRRKQELKALAAEAQNEQTLFGLLELLEATLSVSHNGSAIVLGHAHALMQRLQYSEKLLARAVHALAGLPFESLMEEAETEAQVAQFTESCRDLFMQRSDSKTLIEAVGAVFTSLPEDARMHILEDIHQDLRIQLARLLGPRGEFSASKSGQIHATIFQIIVIGRQVDISDVAKLPLWPSLASGNAYVQQLVRAIGMKGDASLVKLTVQKLASREPAPAVDDILRVLVSAKLRDIDADFNLPVDLAETQPTSESVWRSAVAAGVI